MEAGDQIAAVGGRSLPDAIARRHGGALDAAIARHGGTRADWLDLSTGINPAPPPLPALDTSLFQRLPEASLEAAAITAARRFYGAPEPADIVASPGSQALISALPHLVAPTTVAILEPTYSEHRAAFEQAGHRVVGLSTPGEIPDAATIVVVVNPNNPDGRVFDMRDLLALAARLSSKGGLLVVDEAFADVEPRQSLAGATGRPGLLVHRSFGKFFGLAGLRLGFALTDDALAETLRRRLGAWATSGPALAVGAAFLGDAALCDALRETIRGQSKLLGGVLSRAGLPLVGATALFSTIRHRHAGSVFEALCRRRILTRPFAYDETWLRLGNVRDPAQAERLEAALRGALAEVAALPPAPGPRLPGTRRP